MDETSREFRLRPDAAHLASPSGPAAQRPVLAGAPSRRRLFPSRASANESRDAIVTYSEAEKRAAAEEALRAVLHPHWDAQHDGSVEKAFRDGYKRGDHSVEAVVAGLQRLKNADPAAVRDGFGAARAQYDFDAPFADEPRAVIDQALRGMEAHRLDPAMLTPPPSPKSD